MPRGTSWKSSDKTLLMSKVRENGLDKGAQMTSQIINRTVGSCKSMWYTLNGQRKESAAKMKVPETVVTPTTPPSEDQEVSIPFRTVRVDLKNKQLIVKL